jgi:hypothetical protein
VTTLAQMSASLPGLTAGIRERLLETIHQILAKRTWRHSHGLIAESAKAVVALGFTEGKETPEQGLVRLALRTLATFDLDHPAMLSFMADCAVGYMESDAWETRKDAGVACAHLLERRGGAMAGTPAGVARRMHAGVEEVLDKLLVVAVADPKPEVRQVMINVLCHARHHCFDSHLAQVCGRPTTVTGQLPAGRALLIHSKQLLFSFVSGAHLDGGAGGLTARAIHWSQRRSEGRMCHYHPAGGAAG